MGLILAALCLVTTLCIAAVLAMGGAKGDSRVALFWPTVAVGFGLTILFAASHFLHWGW